MSDTPQPLCFRRTIALPPELVFQAWTDLDVVKRWWGPSGCYTPDAEIDLRPGGRYRFTMVGPHGNTFFLSGTYREVRPPHKLVFSWAWEGTDMDGTESLVTVEFAERGGATEVIVTHAGLKPDMIAAHTHGWTGSLDRLEETL